MYKLYMFKEGWEAKPDIITEIGGSIGKIQDRQEETGSGTMLGSSSFSICVGSCERSPRRGFEL